MISIIICSQSRDVVMATEENIRETIGVDVELIVIPNAEGKFGICHAYNTGALKARYDIFCFMHEDISYETKNWGERVIRHLSNKKTGLIGIAGGDTKSMTPSSWPSSIFESEISIIQHYKSKDKPPKKIITTGYPDNSSQYKKVTCIDGVWMCTRRDVFDKYQFDEKTFTGFHGYDIDFSLQVGLSYQVCAVSDILIHHYSEGSFNNDWLKSTIVVSKKWKKQLPRSARSLSHQEYVRQHWTSMNVFIDKMIELNYSRFSMIANTFPFAFNRYFKLINFLYASRKVMLKLREKQKKDKVLPGYELIIYDDFYPHPLSGFRYEEFTYLLKNIPGSKAMLTGGAYTHFNLSPEQHKTHIDEVVSKNPEIAHSIQIINGKIDARSKLFYCVFLNNIFQKLSWLEENDIPFIFTLYPGGGFMPGAEETESRLKRLFASPCFRKVIVTQQRTYDYLTGNGFCKETDILMVFGVVVPQESLLNNIPVKKQYGQHKNSFDICFCAAKYTKYGEDKGYPIFIDFAKAMTAKYPFLAFHVIGGFDKDVIDVSSLGNRIRFYGYQDYHKLKAIFQEMDLIISPNQPNMLGKGAFDGFPLGTVIEAALNEVAVMLTDCFEENKYFEDGKELVIIQPDVADMMEKFETYFNEAGSFYKIAQQGKLKFQSIYSNEYQMKPRLQLLQSSLTDNNRQ